MATKTRKRKPAGNGKAALPITTTEPEERALTKPGSPAVNVEFLLAKAIDKGDMVTVDKLLAVRRELKAEWAMEQFFADLAAFQAECPVIKKTKEGDGGKWSYAPIEQIKKQVGGLWDKHGFSHTIKTVQPDMQNVTAEVHVHHRDGHEEITSITMPLDTRTTAAGKDLQNAPQRVKSARSYARRCAIEDAYGIVTEDEDDDGHGVGPDSPPPAPEAPRASQREAPRDVTPPKAPEAPKAEAKPETPAGRQLPKELAGVHPVGAACYWLLSDNIQPKGPLPREYAEKQGKRIANNRGNENFLANLKTEIELAIEEWKAAKT